MFWVKFKKIYLEDPKQPLLGPNVWILRLTGLLLSNNRFIKIAYICNHLIVTVFIVTQCIEVWCLRNEPSQMLYNLKFTCLSFVNVFKATTFIVWQEKWKCVLDYVTEADLEERVHKDPARKNVVENYTRYCRKITYIYWFMAYITIVFVISNPLITYIFTPNYVEKMQKETLPFPHILSAWVPFDKNDSPACWCLVCWHIQLSIYGGSIMASYDASMLVIMIFIEKKIDLLQQKCSMLFDVSDTVISDEEFYTRIEECHRIHNLLLKNARLLNSVLSPAMFLYVIVCSMYLCASAIQLTVETTTAELILSTEYLTFGIVQLFVYCFYSNKVMYKNMELCFGLYDSKWWQADKSKQVMALILGGQMRQSVVFTAGPFTDLTLATFTTILKGAYSYYTLLRD